MSIAVRCWVLTWHRLNAKEVVEVVVVVAVVVVAVKRRAPASS